MASVYITGTMGDEGGGEWPTLIGPFPTEREALFYYGFANHTHGQHHECITAYDDDDDLERLEPQPELISPDPVLLEDARNLIAMEDGDTTEEEAAEEHAAQSTWWR